MLTERRRDYFAGLLMVLVGSIGAVVGSHYEMGRLTSMGPGYFPTALSVLLVILGIAIAGVAATRPKEQADKTIEMLRPEWRGWICIIAGALLFIALSKFAGLVPAAFGCVFVSAMGDRQTKPLQAALLAAGVAVFAYFLFSLFLKVQIPAFGAL